MQPEQSESLLKAIEEKFFPENGVFGTPKLALEQIEASHALVWVEDRLLKVGYKEEGGKFTVGAATRLSKAELKKHQLDDGTPMTIDEEKEESEELAAAAAANSADLTDVTDPTKNEDPKVTPQPVGGSDTASKAKACKDCGEVHAPGQQKCSAAKNTGTEMDSAADLDKSLDTGTAMDELAKDEDPGLDKHAFTEGQSKVKYLVPDGRHLPYTDAKGSISHARMGAAWAALHGGYRGNAYGGPDKDKAIARLKSLYQSEGMDLPSEKAAGVGELEKIEAADASLEEITRKFEKLMKEFKEFEALGGGEMDAKEKERLEKARKSIHGHIADMGKALSAHKAAHETVHKAHGALLDAHKAVHEAHKAAHDARMVHKAAHDAFHDKASAALDGMAKVVGGGPESFGEFGEPDTAIDQDPKVTPQPAGGSDIATKAEINTMVAKAVGDAMGEIKTMLAKVAGAKVDDPPAPKKEDPPATGTLSKSDILGAFTQVFGELTKSLEADAAAPGPGSRASKRAFTKAEDAGVAGGGNPVVEMTKEDWEAYRRGDNKAFKKAQALTSTKWQPVPDRLMKRRQASA